MIDLPPEAVEAFRRKDHAALHAALNLKPWQVNPLEVDDGPPGWGPGTAGAASWPAAQRMRKALQAAVKAARK